VWLKFRGGKGVATLLGILLGLQLWEAAGVYAAVWILLLVMVRISSLAGIAAALSAPIVAFAIESSYFPLLLGFALLVVWKHRENIVRLTKGIEPRIGSGRARSR
jgi:glycerol-3-phosphate acyltransferase PlsY